MMENVLALFKKTKAFAFDMDGVMTDGSVHVSDDGIFSRIMNIKDGYALQYAVRQGYPVFVISGAQSEGAKERFSRLGIKEAHFGVPKKTELLQELLHKYRVAWEECLFMSDDLPDFAVMQKVGMPVCPADAVPQIKSLCKYISPVAGGRGCVRDVIEKAMTLQNKWENNQEEIASK